MIAIDFREGAKTKRAGKGQYVYELTKVLIERYPEESWVLLTHANQTIDLPAGNWTQRKFSPSPLLWHPQVLWWLMMKRDISCYFATTSTIVPALHVRPHVVTTIFDFSIVHYSSTHLPKAVLLEKLTLPTALRRSHHLLSISQATAQECQDIFHVPAHKLTVTPLAAGSGFKPLELSDDQVSRLRQKYSLPEKFILYLGTLEPRKNIGQLIASYRAIASEFPEHKLVLAGAKGWLDDSTLAGEDIIQTGFVADEDRAALYNLAEIFVFPSLYEGFGIPPLEAMSCGTPVITSNTSSLPEVVGSSAILIDPKSSDSLTEAMRRLLSSKELRDELSHKGLEQAKLFNWHRTADITYQVLKRYV